MSARYKLVATDSKRRDQALDSFWKMGHVCELGVRRELTADSWVLASVVAPSPELERLGSVALHSGLVTFVMSVRE